MEKAKDEKGDGAFNPLSSSPWPGYSPRRPTFLGVKRDAMWTKGETPFREQSRLRVTRRPTRDGRFPCTGITVKIRIDKLPSATVPFRRSTAHELAAGYFWIATPASSFVNRSRDKGDTETGLLSSTGLYSDLRS